MVELILLRNEKRHRGVSHDEEDSIGHTFAAGCTDLSCAVSRSWAISFSFIGLCALSSSRADMECKSSPVFIALPESKHDIRQVVHHGLGCAVHQVQCGDIIRFRKAVRVRESGLHQSRQSELDGS